MADFQLAMTGTSQGRFFMVCITLGNSSEVGQCVFIFSNPRRQVTSSQVLCYLVDGLQRRAEGTTRRAGSNACPLPSSLQANNQTPPRVRKGTGAMNPACDANRDGTYRGAHGW